MLLLAALMVGQATLKPPTFMDVTAAMGLALANDEACWIDVDRDGWTDLVAGGVVWRNDHGKRFEKLAEGLGSVVAADFDNDGYPDLFSFSQMKLYKNVGGKRFVEFPLPKLPPTVSLGACWGDFDNDGFVDLYVGGYEDWDKGITYPSFILMNRGGKRFELTWTDNTYRTRGVTACDFNRDGALDIYVSNYRLQPNELWLNDGKGHFRDVAPGYNAAATSPGFEGGHSIGAAWADFDNDGEFDLFAGNFAHVDTRGDQPKSRFLRNLGRKGQASKIRGVASPAADSPNSSATRPKVAVDSSVPRPQESGAYQFEDLGPCGVWYQESYASPAAGDYDNDGSVDLFFTTVYAIASFNKPNYPVLYRNMGAFKFKDATAGSGLEKLPPTYQAAFADFRNDGRLDLCTAGKLFENQGPTRHWLEVRLEGDGKKVNRSAIGAQVRIKINGKTLTRQVEAGTGQGNQNDLKLHFGLGDWGGKVNLEISWPGGKVQTVRHVAIDRLVDVRFKD